MITMKPGNYGTISAFIKNVRGAEPDAAIYRLAKMLCVGDTLHLIARWPLFMG